MRNTELIQIDAPYETLVPRGHQVGTINLENYDCCNLFMLGFSLICGYFTMFIFPIFLDLIFGFGKIIDCMYNEEPFLDIFIWMSVNGVFSLCSLGCLIMRRRLLIPYDFFWYKLFYLADIVINIFILIWTAIGMASFFIYYNIYDNSYVLVRMVLAPVICVLRLVDIYYR
jgi:hypothetical protein